MMGFSEEPGIIPRFCEDLFSQVARKQTQEVCSYSTCKLLIRVENSQIKLKSVMATKEILNARSVLIYRSLFFGTVVWRGRVEILNSESISPGGQ